MNPAWHVFQTPHIVNWLSEYRCSYWIIPHERFFAEELCGFHGFWHRSICNRFFDKRAVCARAFLGHANSWTWVSLYSEKCHTKRTDQRSESVPSGQTTASTTTMSPADCNVEEIDKCNTEAERETRNDLHKTSQCQCACPTIVSWIASWTCFSLLQTT